ncbi:aldehyde ferredoxin oxidoreductase family protein [Desulfobotulus mexicanus]|uniref:Aldehyde ferredoxin oxidoreductase family protein n=1 Tax=Desulfobotulus mexicanus TaxID=2586642 RepID=A0A5Q4VDZ3_9BACT|nr:aldehyde ferredoxin oxidoreductase family protein [Desulfobotulus mexicanus]TYT75146.1 aldehyde ferredoxin oxidoreductase family protein [Desulfobotulus mexicanus]
MKGWCGRILNVDLSRGTLEPAALNPLDAQLFIGGRGLNDKVLFDRIPPGTDPLGPENVICFAPGPLSGTVLGLTSRVEVSTLSPYSGILGDGNAGERLAHVMKLAGWDQINITGRCERPSYLYIHEDEVSLIPCPEHWGTDTWEFTEAMRNTHDRDISVACIGQAGECLVRFASVIVDKYASAARGAGAVMGSKNLKGIVVRGNRKVKLADPETFKALAKEDRNFFKTDPFQKGVASCIGSHHGILNWFPGYRNYEDFWDRSKIPAAIQPEAFKEYEVRRTGCRNCTVQCKNRFEIPKGRRAGEQGEAMEYECVFCLGTNCGITDPVVIMEMENLCDRYGMDIIAAGNTMAMVKDLFNMGDITIEDTGGLDLSWENADDQVKLLHRTALRQGFGNIVAEGLYLGAKILGKRAMDVCYHVKGLSRGPYKSGMFALAHATSTRGADHLRGRSWAYGENDGDLFSKLKSEGRLPADMADNPVSALIVSERACTLADCIGRCKGAVNSWSCAVPLVNQYPLMEGLARLMTAATGVPYTEERLSATADRVYLLEKAFNIRCGTRRQDDRLVLHKDLLGTEEAAKEQEKHEAMLTAYYEASGQDLVTGIPTRRKLEELELGFVADTLEKELPLEPWDGPKPWPLNAYPSGEKRV